MQRTRGRVASSTLSYNTAREHGGAIVAMDGVSLAEVRDSTLSNNAAKYGGGIDAIQSSRLRVFGGKLSRNTASVFGGGIFVSTSSSALVNGTVLQENTCKPTVNTSSKLYYGGGAICVYQDAGLMMIGATVVGNAVEGGTVESIGAGIYLYACMV